MSAELALSIDGRDIRVAPGTTLREACQLVGTEIPTLCFNPNFTAANACRLCVVELEGARTLVPACSRAVESGMRIQTASDRVRHSRRLVLELLGSSVDLSLAPDLGELLREYGGRPERFSEAGSATVEQPVKVDNELYVRDYSRCVLCYRCVQACGVEAQNTFAIWVSGRGFEARISTEYDAPLPDSACVYCGNCIEVCPTGALMFKSEFDLRAAGTWDEGRQSTTTTICSYCGVGCSLDLVVQDNQIVRVNSPEGNDITLGNLCIKGRFGHQFVSEPKRRERSS
ncbi:MAG: Fe-S-binding domain-containing protein [Chloroflexi bacterium]|nr:MAG: Fe-S-binding domain-containing protein [Chloroflexota bacterium]